MRLFSNRSQKTLKCGKNISDTLDYRLVWNFLLLARYWRHLRSIIEQTHGNMESIFNCVITQVIIAFWLVLAYDLLEDRGTIDVIITKFFPLCFKMAVSFENLDNILRDWEKYNIQKVLPRHWTGSRNRKKKDKAVSLRKWSRKNSWEVSISRQSSETKPSTKLVLVNWETLLYLEFNKDNEQNVSEINLF